MKENDLIQKIKHDKNQLWLYGAGSLAETIFDYLCRLEVNVSGVIVDDEFYSKGKTVRSLSVVPLSEVDKTNISIIAAHGEYVHIREQCAKYGIKTVYYFASVVYGRIERNTASSELKLYDEKLAWLRGQLADDISLNNLRRFLEATKTGDASCIMDSYNANDYFSNDVFKLGVEETLLDIGAFNGDTISDFIGAVDNQFHYIYAFEADDISFDLLKKSTETLEKVKVYNVCLWNRKGKIAFGNQNNDTREEGIASESAGTRETETLDDVLKDRERITLLKINFPGAIHVLEGGVDLLKSDLPSIACTVGWNLEELISVPKLIKTVNPEYKIYLRYRLPLTDGFVLYATI